MKPEEKNWKQGAEINDEELDGVAGGQGTLHAPFFGDPGVGKYAGASNAKASVPGVDTNVINPSNRENLGKM